MKITLKQLLKALSRDSLSFMADSNHSNGSIAVDQIPKVVSRINSVLRRLNVKFTLSEKTVRLYISDDRRYYPLEQPLLWTTDNVDYEFLTDVERILAVQQDDGRMIPLNDLAVSKTIRLRDNGRSLFLTQAVPAGWVNVIYKAKTPQFVEDVEDLNQTIEFPEALLNALYSAVAAISYEGIGGAENIQLAANKWTQYEKECLEAVVNSAVEIEEYEEANLHQIRGYR